MLTLQVSIIVLIVLITLPSLFYHAPVFYFIFKGYVCSTRNMTRDRARDHLFTWLDEDSVFALNTYKSKYDNLNCKWKMKK